MRPGKRLKVGDRIAFGEATDRACLLAELAASIVEEGEGGEVVLAGFYKQDLSFAFAPAFMREAQIRVAAQWQKQDLQAVTALVERGALSLDGLITHTLGAGRARQAYEAAFGDPQCLKMMIDWHA